ncbi:hypothetical protein RUM43_003921 [Polyplax serrata]|uniref:Uncharacterized protein n=1 Tax=Polyplax serrata TaxID=468196 RepID=A0AAN8SAD7_POLSC
MPNSKTHKSRETFTKVLCVGNCKGFRSRLKKQRRLKSRLNDFNELILMPTCQEGGDDGTHDIRQLENRLGKLIFRRRRTGHLPPKATPTRRGGSSNRKWKPEQDEYPRGMPVKRHSPGQPLDPGKESKFRAQVTGRHFSHSFNQLEFL